VQKRKIIDDLLNIDNSLKDAILLSDNSDEFITAIRKIIDKYFAQNKIAEQYYNNNGKELFDKLTWQDFAAIRIKDMLQYEGEKFTDPNLHNATIINFLTVGPNN